MSELKVQVDSDLRNPILVSISEYRGVERLDIRHHYVDGSGEYRPTQKGISIPVSYAESLMIVLETAVPNSDNTPLLVQVDCDVRDPLHVSLAPYRNEMRLDVRHYYDDYGALKPGRKGVNLLWTDREQLLHALRELLGDRILFPA
jgi:hypothetical protein